MAAGFGKLAGLGLLSFGIIYAMRSGGSDGTTVWTGYRVEQYAGGTDYITARVVRLGAGSFIVQEHDAGEWAYISPFGPELVTHPSITAALADAATRFDGAYVAGSP